MGLFVLILFALVAKFDPICGWKHLKDERVPVDVKKTLKKIRDAEKQYRLKRLKTVLGFFTIFDPAENALWNNLSDDEKLVALGLDPKNIRNSLTCKGFWLDFSAVRARLTFVDRPKKISLSSGLSIDLQEMCSLAYCIGGVLIVLIFLGASPAARSFVNGE